MRTGVVGTPRDETKRGSSINISRIILSKRQHFFGTNRCCDTHRFCLVWYMLTRALMPPKIIIPGVALPASGAREVATVCDRCVCREMSS